MAATSRLRTRLQGVVDSYWFVPTISLFVATALAFALIELDARLDFPLGERFPRLFGASAGAARGTLTAIATSMITVAGVVFSVTVVALSLAASTYSPRVLRTFMHDRPPQFAFGVFVGVFVYCLIVLRTVRGGEDEGSFVPTVSVLAALLLALASAWVLVYFIHHVALSIQVSTIIERIAVETRGAIDRLFPQSLGAGDDDGDGDDVSADDRFDWQPVPARRSGYIVGIDTDRLIAFARGRGAVLRMDLGVGEFAIEGQPLASLSGARRRGTDADADADADALADIYTVAGERTIDQDAEYGVQQLVDVATRALSPGVNDPGTAMRCIDQLSTVLVRMAARRLPSRRRLEDGELRLLATGPTFDGMVQLTFEPLARYGSGKTEVLASLERAARAVEAAALPHRRPVLQRQLDRIGRLPRG